MLKSSFISPCVQLLSDLGFKNMAEQSSFLTQLVWWRLRSILTRTLLGPKFNSHMITSFPDFLSITWTEIARFAWFLVPLTNC